MKAEWSECLLEQARRPPTGLEFPFEVIWFLDSCQAPTIYTRLRM